MPDFYIEEILNLKSLTSGTLEALNDMHINDGAADNLKLQVDLIKYFKKVQAFNKIASSIFERLDYIQKYSGYIDEFLKKSPTPEEISNVIFQFNYQVKLLNQQIEILKNTYISNEKIKLDSENIRNSNASFNTCIQSIIQDIDSKHRDSERLVDLSLKKHIVAIKINDPSFHQKQLKKNIKPICLCLKVVKKSRAVKILISLKI